jgi:hypothetical protein
MIMKKLALVCVAALMAYGAQAQTTKGTIVLTGKAGYTQYKGETEKKSEGNDYGADGYSSTLAPSIGVFVKDNLEIGSSLNYSRHKSENITSTSIYSSSFLSESRVKDFRVYARQYKFLTERFAVHGTLAAGVGNREESRVHTSVHQYYPQTDNQREETNSFNIGLSPGLTFFASNKVGLHASLGALSYSRHLDKREYSTTNLIHPPHSPDRNDFSYKTNHLRLDFSSMHLNFGISYFIGN